MHCKLREERENSEKVAKKERKIGRERKKERKKDRQSCTMASAKGTRSRFKHSKFCPNAMVAIESNVKRKN